jgi:dTDP-4-dehydrorhamnose 3,5-epimerase
VRFLPTSLPGVIIVEPDVYRDPRGFLFESYQAERYRRGGITAAFVQDNHSLSVRGVLRGLHGQRRRVQGKLVRALRGEIFDVAVDARPDSPAFRRWIGVKISADNFRQLWIPPGFLHGFCALSDLVEVEYKCTDYYDEADQIAVRWNDPDLGIEWPVAEPILSAKDGSAPLLAEIAGELPSVADCT